MKLIGLSGGIAAGKSTIAKRLAELGAVHIDADQLAREVVEPGTHGLRAIRERFGDDVISEDGSLDRAALGAKVFSDPVALEALNNITHPAVRALTQERIRDAAATDPDAVVVYDVPLLVEADVDLPWDLIVMAEAPAETRIERMTQLRGMTRDEAERRIARQASDADRRAFADVVIDTGGDIASTVQQVDALWKQLQEATVAGSR